jgi:nucleoid-associated protein YgaU
MSGSGVEQRQRNDRQHAQTSEGTRSGGPRRGRHRKPSSTNRAIARTVVAGAVVGTPLATAGTAQAASDNTWDRVAQCESGGNWAISTGNGFQGGLQFTQSTWRSFGGTSFASSPNRASREQQIAVAEKVLAGQGWGAWPVCSRKARATGESATPRVVTARAVGTRSNRTPTPVAASAGRHALRPAAPQRAAVRAQPPAAHAVPVVQIAERLRPLVDPAPTATAVSLPLTALPLTALPAAAPAVPAVPTPRAPAPAATRPGPTVLAAAPAPAGVAAPRAYQVRPGDTLAGIARTEHVDGGWQAIYRSNRAAIGDANLIRPGQLLTLT